MDRFLLVLFVLFACFGCDSAGGDAQRLAETPQTSPEDEFEWVIKRLERAVLDFSSTERAGLRIGDRKLAHQLIPPSEATPHYTAIVMISSEKGYLPDQSLVTLSKKKIKQDRREAMKRFNEHSGFDDRQSDAFDPITDQLKSQMEEVAANRSGPIRTSGDLDIPMLKDEKIYELAYLDGRWQVHSKLETETEQLWFQYALNETPEN